MALQYSAQASRACRRCGGTVDPSGDAWADARRLYCDACRELARITTHLRQAQVIAERLGYDSTLAARIRLAIKAAQR